MAFALTSHEVRVSEILKASNSPMSASEILDVLKSQFKMHSVRLSDVNTTLHVSGIYHTVSSGSDVKWCLGLPDAAGDSAVSFDKSSLFHQLTGIPPIDVVPDGEFQGGRVLVGGDSDDDALVKEVVAKLLLKGAGSLVCLVGQKAGKLAAASSSCEEIAYAPEPSRADFADSHRKAIEDKKRAAALVLIGSESSSYSAHHALIACETLGVPVYCARPE